MFESAKRAGCGLALLLAITLISCKSDNSSSNTVTSRTVSVRLRANQTVTYRARFIFDGVTVVASASSVVTGGESVILVNLDALSVPRGHHVIDAVILAAVPTPAEYRMTASVSENNQVVKPEVPDAVANLGINGIIELAIDY